MSKSAFGLSLEISNNSSTGFHAIGELEDINLPVIDTDQIDITTHHNTSNSFEVLEHSDSEVVGTYVLSGVLGSGSARWINQSINNIYFDRIQISQFISVWLLLDDRDGTPFSYQNTNVGNNDPYPYTSAWDDDSLVFGQTPANNKRLSVKGLTDNGEIGLTINYDPASPPTISSTSNTNLYSHIQQIDSTLYFKVKQGGATQMSFKGLLIGVEQGTAIDNVVKMTLNVKVTEQITY